MCDQQSLRPACTYAQSDQSLCKSLECSMSVKLLSEQHLEFLSLKGGFTCLSESTHIKMQTLLEITSLFIFFSSIFCLSGPMLTVRFYFILSSWHNRVLVLLMLNSLPPIVLCCQIAFAKGLNPDQVRKNVWPDLDAIYLTQMIFEKEFFFWKSSDKKHEHISRGQS